MSTNSRHQVLSSLRAHRHRLFNYVQSLPPTVPNIAVTFCTTYTRQAASDNDCAPTPDIYACQRSSQIFILFFMSALSKHYLEDRSAHS